MDEPNKYKSELSCTQVDNWFASGLSSVTVASWLERYLAGV